MQERGRGATVEELEAAEDEEDAAASELVAPPRWNLFQALCVTSLSMNAALGQSTMANLGPGVGSATQSEGWKVRNSSSTTGTGAAAPSTSIEEAAAMEASG